MKTQLPLVSVIGGNIALVESDALITSINSQCGFAGGIDVVIRALAGHHFHKQAEAAMPLHDQQAIVAKGEGCFHGGKFENVIFVVDERKMPLSNIVYAGLRAAAIANYKIVTLPTIRMGTMNAVVEKTAEEATKQMVIGVKSYMENSPNCSIQKIRFVVYDDRNLQSLLATALAESISSN